MVRDSPRAKTDLFSIGSYTLQQWGVDQAARYLDQLEECCNRLGKRPAIQPHMQRHPAGLRRVKQGKHVIFYRQQPDGIFVVRVLHQRMLPTPQFRNE